MSLRERLIAAGVLVPDKRGVPAADRIGAMKRGLIELLEEFQPQAIVLEWTSGKVAGRHGGGGAGLAIYGLAVGALWQVCEYWATARGQQGRLPTVARVNENDWTQGRPKLGTRKPGQVCVSRVGVIAGLYPEYDRAKDPGGDIADAIGLALWYLRSTRLQSVMERIQK